MKQISEIMIKQLQDRMKEKEVELEVRNNVKEILVEQGFDPIYGARPLRRAVMRLLEDTLAQECLSTPLYPYTKLKVTRKELERTPWGVTYSNDVAVEIDYTNVDPELIKTKEQENTNENEESTLSVTE